MIHALQEGGIGRHTGLYGGELQLYKHRKCEAQDYGAIAAMRNLVTVEQVTGEALHKSDEYAAAQPDAVVSRMVAEDSTGSIVGYALVAHFAGMLPGRWWIHVTVHPEMQRRGIGRQLYRAAEEMVREHGATEVESVCSEEETEKNYAFAVSQGFRSDRKRFQMVLDLPGWDGTCADPYIQGVTARGLQVGLFPSAPSDQLLRSLYDLVIHTETDVPSFEGVQPGFGDWAEEFMKRKQAVAVVRDGERVVAASFIQLPDDRATGCYIPYTGVVREYRGQGLARAVKLAAIHVARDKGYPFVWTHNDLDNPAIMSLNLSMGFRQRPGLYRLKKGLTAMS